MNENNNDASSSKARDHMANERTFLAWIRTSIGIMAFGFVVDKFALFLKEFSYIIGKSPLSKELNVENMPSAQHYSSFFGIFLVFLGAVLSFLAFVKYKMVEYNIEHNKYRATTLLDSMLTLSVLSIGAVLVVYLFMSI